MEQSAHKVARRDQIPGIDGLRAVAALGVFCVHLQATLIALYGPSAIGPSSLHTFFAIGGSGVMLFFILSGFLLSLPFARHIVAGEGRLDLRRYARARILRILPAYWFALTVVLVFTGIGFRSLRVALIDYFFLQNFWMETRGTGLSVAWTLGIEVQFYLVLPCLSWAGARSVGGEQDIKRRAIRLGRALALATLLSWGGWRCSARSPTCVLSVPPWRTHSCRPTRRRSR